MILKVEDVHVEITLEGGETLGRWSLYDVHARRLIASAFELTLAGEEVTFLADDPIDFAYRGVEHMAEAWARLKAKNVARRAVAVRRSRRATLPSRIGELGGAMTDTVREFTGLAPASEPEPLPGASAVVEAPSPERVLEPAVAPEPVDSAEVRALVEERRRLEAERRRLGEERRKLVEERRKAEEVLEKLRAKVEPEPEPEPVATEPEPVAAEPEPVAAEPEPEPEPEPDLTAAEPEPVAAEPEPVEIPLATLADGPREVVVDLKDLEDAEVPAVDGESGPETAIAGAAPAKTGLMGAVRAAFTRSSRNHAHVFAEAPGGMGIVRKICVECGYVSISTED